MDSCCTPQINFPEITSEIFTGANSRKFPATFSDASQQVSFEISLRIPCRIFSRYFGQKLFQKSFRRFLLNNFKLVLWLENLSRDSFKTLQSIVQKFFQSYQGIFFYENLPCIASEIYPSSFSETLPDFLNKFLQRSLYKILHSVQKHYKT